MAANPAPNIYCGEISDVGTVKSATDHDWAMYTNLHVYIMHFMVDKNSLQERPGNLLHIHINWSGTNGKKTYYYYNK